MVTRANKLYVKLQLYAGLQSVTICSLHFSEPGKRCPESKFFCGRESEKPVINFDAVKDRYCQQEKIPQVLPSVDAVTFKGEMFIFIEIKSWRNFDVYQLNKDDDEEIKQHKIESQAKKFKLKQKIEKSIEICQRVSEDKSLFDTMPVLYVLITDVETVLDPMVRFKAMLGVLSYKAINIPLYTQVSENELKALGMNVRYKSCREFDSFYDGL